MNTNFYKSLLPKIDSHAHNSYILTIADGENLGSKLFLSFDKNNNEFTNLTYEDSSLEDFWQNIISKIEFSRAPYLDENGIFVESLNPKIQLIVCGGGHVSLALSKLSDFMGFELTILEDRAEFGNYQKFPNAKNIIVDSFDNIFKNNSFDKNACFVIATRGHICDALCLENVMNLEYCYAGMIGSKRKIAKTKDLMLSKGFSEEAFDNIKTPIGIPIGGQTPEEISISIMAEIIQTLNQNPRSYFSEIIKNSISSEDEKMILAKIIYKSGSSPRGIGSQMIIKKDGSTIDTIGGGLIEFSAIKEAVNILNTNPYPLRKHYVLNTEEAASLGMWCGGNLDILFDIIN